MFLAHSFRLRDPWQCEAFPGRVRWTRSFHSPTGIEPDDALWLVISGLPAAAEVRLNGNLLASESVTLQDVASSGQFHVTGHLAPTNRIEIIVPQDPQAAFSPPGKFPYDARLGIVAVS
jgi:hypothetical protein